MPQKRAWLLLRRRRVELSLPNYSLPVAAGVLLGIALSMWTSSVLAGSLFRNGCERDEHTAVGRDRIDRSIAAGYDRQRRSDVGFRSIEVDYAS